MPSPEGDESSPLTWSHGYSTACQSVMNNALLRKVVLAGMPLKVSSSQGMMAHFSHGQDFFLGGQQQDFTCDSIRVLRFIIQQTLHFFHPVLPGSSQPVGQ